MANENIRKEYTGSAVPTTLAAGINDVVTSCVLTAGSSYPTGSSAPFVLALDRDSATEEKILCSARATNTITILQRGYDGTTAQAHSSGATVTHVLDAYAVQQTNWVVNGYDAVTGTKGTTGYPLVAGATLPSFAQLGTTGIADAAVTVAKLAAGISQGSVGYAEITSNSAVITSVASVAGLSVTFTADASRRYRTSFSGELLGSIAGDLAYVYITDSSNVVKRRFPVVVQAAGATGVTFDLVETGLSGSITRKIRLERNTGTGNVYLPATTTGAQAFILIEDIGT